MAGTTGGGGGFDAEQLHNASVIIAVGRQLGASTRDIQTAIMTALVESGLHNVDYGDRDSLGLFQQRATWGTRQQRMDPATAARMFFQGGTSADGYSEPGLFDIKNRNQMSMGQAAQAVQVSAYPDRYAEQQNVAARLLHQVGDVRGIPGTLGEVPGPNSQDLQLSINDALQGTLGNFPGVQPSTPEVNPLGEEVNSALGGPNYAAVGDPAGMAALDTPVFGEPVAQNNPLASMQVPGLDQFGVNYQGADMPGGDRWRQRVVKIAHQYLGTPYVWGGTNPSGFDCSGLVQYVYKQLGVNLPRLSWDQANHGKHVGLDQLKPGDLVAWDNSPDHAGADHIALYIGNGQVIEAPRPGGAVQVSGLYDTGQAWGVRMHR